MSTVDMPEFSWYSRKQLKLEISEAIRTMLADQYSTCIVSKLIAKKSLVQIPYHTTARNTTHHLIIPNNVFP